MKPADICTTLRLPTRVRANKPAFSLHKSIGVMEVRENEAA